MGWDGRQIIGNKIFILVVGNKITSADYLNSKRISEIIWINLLQFSGMIHQNHRLKIFAKEMNQHFLNLHLWMFKWPTKKTEKTYK